MEQTIPVALGDRSYNVTVGAGLLEQLGQAAAAVGQVEHAVVISDSTVGQLYGQRAVASLQDSGLGAALVHFPAGEPHKTLATAGRLYDELLGLSPAIDRRTLIVALGGGVTGDLSGFVAATLLRGLRWIQCPTTLLADVDASVGGKTGVDHPAGKNLIGAFHQPRAVLIDVGLLESLPEAELANGLAECVKHAVIRDGSLLDFIEDHLREILRRDPETMTDLIARNVRIKAEVVSADEREAGQREHLNFGHTIGHAVESVVGFDKISHGQAVSLGMVAACRMAVFRGLIEDDAARRVLRLLASLALPTWRENLDVQAVWQAMLHDKKARAGQVRMVLPVMLGQAAVFEDITPSAAQEAIATLGKKP